MKKYRNILRAIKSGELSDETLLSLLESERNSIVQKSVAKKLSRKINLTECIILALFAWEESASIIAGRIIRGKNSSFTQLTYVVAYAQEQLQKKRAWRRMLRLVKSHLGDSEKNRITNLIRSDHVPENLKREMVALVLDGYDCGGSVWFIKDLAKNAPFLLDTWEKYIPKMYMNGRDYMHIVQLYLESIDVERPLELTLKPSIEMCNQALKQIRKCPKKDYGTLFNLEHITWFLEQIPTDGIKKNFVAIQEKCAKIVVDDQTYKKPRLLTEDAAGSGEAQKCLLAIVECAVIDPKVKERAARMALKNVHMRSSHTQVFRACLRVAKAMPELQRELLAGLITEKTSVENLKSIVSVTSSRLQQEALAALKQKPVSKATEHFLRKYEK